MSGLVIEAALPEGQIQVISQAELWESLRQLSADQKVRGALGLMGCEFWDDEQRYVRDNSVALIGLGGAPVALPGEPAAVAADRIENFAKGSRGIMEMSAGFSYLNSGNAEAGVLYSRVVGLGHLSIAHTVAVNVLVAGVTINTEAEMNCQRDLVHLSRLTVARTAIQEEPAIVAPDQQSYEIAQAVYGATRAVLDATRPERPTRDDQEIRNAFYPVNKATAFMVSGTLRNVAKVTEFVDDEGKEREYRRVLSKIRATLQPIWPELFK